MPLIVFALVKRKVWIRRARHLRAKAKEVMFDGHALTIARLIQGFGSAIGSCLKPAYYGTNKWGRPQNQAFDGALEVQADSGKLKGPTAALLRRTLFEA